MYQFCCFSSCVNNNNNNNQRTKTLHSRANASVPSKYLWRVYFSIYFIYFFLLSTTIFHKSQKQSQAHYQPMAQKTTNMIQDPNLLELKLLMRRYNSTPNPSHSVDILWSLLSENYDVHRATWLCVCVCFFVCLPVCWSIERYRVGSKKKSQAHYQPMAKKTTNMIQDPNLLELKLLMKRYYSSSLNPSELHVDILALSLVREFPKLIKRYDVHRATWLCVCLCFFVCLSVCVLIEKYRGVKVGPPNHSQANNQLTAHSTYLTQVFLGLKLFGCRHIIS